MLRTAFITCLLLSVAACGVSDTVCTLEARAGVNVTVTDSVSGMPVTSAITVVVEDGSYRDSTTVPGGSSPGSNSVGAAYEREGVYSVRVRADGYALWSTSGVRVESDECHVRGAIVNAKLQRG